MSAGLGAAPVTDTHMLQRRPSVFKPNLEALRSDPKVREEYETCISSASTASAQDVDDIWLHLKGAVQQASHAALKATARRCSNWMTAETLTAIDAKSAAWRALHLALRRPLSMHQGAVSENKRPTAGAHEKRLQERGKSLLKDLRKETRPGEKNSCGSPPAKNELRESGAATPTTDYRLRKQYRIQKSIVRRLVRRDKSTFWSKTAQDLQKAHQQGNLRLAYSSMSCWT